MFNLEKKCVGVVFKIGDGDVEFYWKGVVEIILDLCIYWIDVYGECYFMIDNKFKEFSVVIEGMVV